MTYNYCKNNIVIVETQKIEEKNTFQINHNTTHNGSRRRN